LHQLKSEEGDSKGQSPFVMRGNPSFSPFLKSEEGDSKGQSPFVMRQGRPDRQGTGLSAVYCAIPDITTSCLILLSKSNFYNH